MKYNRIKPTDHGMEIPISRESYPYFSIDLKHLPEAKKWEIGKTYEIALQIKQTGIHQIEGTGDAQFEIHGIKVLAKGDMSNRRYSRDQGEDY